MFCILDGELVSGMVSCWSGREVFVVDFHAVVSHVMMEGTVTQWWVWLLAVVVGVVLTDRSRVVDLWGTFLHELCHGVIAAVTGGRITGVYVHPDGSGHCEYMYRGELSRLLTTFAGYTGPVVLGCLLLVTQFSVPRVTVLLLALVTVLVLLFTRNARAVGLCVGTIVLLGVLMVVPVTVTNLLLLGLGGVITGGGMYKVVESVYVNTVPHEGLSDQESLAELTGVPTMVWCVFMVLFSVGVVLGSVALMAGFIHLPFIG